MSDISPRDIARNRPLSANPQGKDPLDRALVALSRDSAARRRYLHSRWQGALKDLSDCKHQPSEADLDRWWRQRLQTPLGHALSQLDKS
jgi:hypothetical protein